MCDQKFDSQFDTKNSWRICKDSQLICEVEIQGNILKLIALNFHNFWHLDMKNYSP
jgi:hypothetical protein